jgi:ABC-type antimicrobial peptide transport system permease subunit
MANSVETLPVPRALPRSWRVPAVVRLVLQFARRKPLGAIGGVIVLALLIMAVFASQIAPYSYDRSVAGARMKPPSSQYGAGWSTARGSPSRWGSPRSPWPR